MSWMLAIPLLGLATGLRTMTPIAVLCWFAFLGYLPVEGTWAFWTARVVAVVVFSIFALGEYIGDKLPQTPNRTAPFPLLARLGFGSFLGCIVTTAMRGSLVEGALQGAVGAALGTFAGFWVRRELVKKIRCPDWWVALPEDLLAVLCAAFATHLAAR
jgi:uncharacterized membrane protein